MKIVFSTAIVMLMLACNKPADKASASTDTTGSGSASAESAVKPDQLITPGKGIGHLTIGLPVDSAIVRLGSPDSSDAAMGSALLAWYSKDASKHRTAVFAGRNMGNDDVSRIKKIMVSSPWFKTSEGVAAGTSRTDIERNYTLKQVDDLTARQKGLQVFDDNDKGITFDIDSASGKCTAITVHTTHESPQSYINMH
ncbi:hypothetical protein [Dyadobacter sediminis]|uniref:Lipoprotein n=1 Tax=Dyadobacter sediminis TaxID=1493691 RepID=A0A5R9KBJ2_9BACT|nr:hypothetical protein [Dyadobacter sediminis]TLU92128.1 hypothetical protein FEM55_15380 [Dyadobacter sediminis]